jgi:hypothetical protein
VKLRKPAHGLGIDAIVTSSVYFGKPVDIGTVMDRI